MVACVNRLGWWINAPMLAALCSILLHAAPNDYEGKPIATVQFDPAMQPLTFDQLLAILPLKNWPAAARLRSSRRHPALVPDWRVCRHCRGRHSRRRRREPQVHHETGLFHRLLRRRWGPDPPNEGQLLVATKLTLGGPYVPGDTTAAVARIADLLKRNGFYNAGIEPATSIREPTQEVHIDYHVDPGRRAKFDGLVANGDSLRPLDKLIRSSGWKRFRGISAAGIHSPNRAWMTVSTTSDPGIPSTIACSLRLHLVNLDYHAGANTVTPILSIDPGPPVLVRLRGAKLSSGKLRSLLPIYEERSVDRDLLEEGSRDLASYFETQGYLDARANYATANPPNGEQLIDYHVDLGVRHKIVSSKFTAIAISIPIPSGSACP